ncbi:MAG TPA: DUF6636 domain-containing protein [Candidatus Elarobacter sp.]|nr:DUF6636 domain-containing protein [Candidatus Elarobacter sp.]
MRSILRIGLLGAVLAVPSLFALPAPVNAFEIVQFRTPSGNIGCVDVGTSLRCDIRSGIPHAPPRPKNCDLDWGGGYDMGTTGRASVMCAGDTAIDPHSPAIPYGTTWHRGAFRCASKLEGLRCTNASGHGFFLSKDPSYTF